MSVVAVDAPGSHVTPMGLPENLYAALCCAPPVLTQAPLVDSDATMLPLQSALEEKISSVPVHSIAVTEQLHPPQLTLAELPTECLFVAFAGQLWSPDW
jgi:hypothetical protein